MLYFLQTNSTIRKHKLTANRKHSWTVAIRFELGCFGDHIKISMCTFKQLYRIKNSGIRTQVEERVSDRNDHQTSGP